jgi:archaellum component FlaC
MAPTENLHTRDLAWISDFVQEQVMIMLRPMMDHLQQADNSVDYVQRQVHRVSMDVTELRGDMERTNKYLSILRQGLGVQNEGKFVLQRGLEGNTRTVKRLDEQMESLLAVLRGVEDSYSTLCSDFRRSNTKHEELLSRVNEKNHILDALQAKVERIAADTHSWKDDVLNSDARLEAAGWQRELRELRGPAVRLVPKMDEKAVRAPPSAQGVKASADPWTHKKSFASVEVSGSAGGSAPGAYVAGSSLGDSASNHSGSSQQSKRVSRAGSSSSCARILPAEQPEQPPEQTVLVSAAAADEAHENSRLPFLAARPGVARPAGRTAGTEGPRLRFTATMTNPPSRGSHQ